MSDYVSIDALLRRAESGIEAAECHGVLCGVLCAQRAFDPRPWSGYVLGACDPGNAYVREARNELESMSEAALAALNDPEYGFQPMLPPDETPLQLRTQAMSQWCQGYVEGLRLGGIEHPEKLDGDAGEIVRDLGEIGKAGRFHVDDSDENEADFAELVEYLRAGVRLVYDELREAPEQRPTNRRGKSH